MHLLNGLKAHTGLLHGFFNFVVKPISYTLYHFEVTE